MPQYRSLTKAQRAAYDTQVETTHHREVELVVRRRRDGQVVASLTNAFLGGSIQGDEDRTPVTLLEADVLDDDRLLDWTNGEHRKYEIQVIDSRFVADLDDWVDEHVFTGMLWDFERQGDVVRLRAEGAEINAAGSIRAAGWWPARTRATNVLRYLLAAAGAEAKDRSIPNLRKTLPRDVTVGVKRGSKKDGDKRGPKKRRLQVSREDTYWGAAVPVADAIDRDLFTDGRGKFLLRPKVSKPQHRFSNRTLVAPVVEKPGSDEELTNTWIVLGANPKGPRKRVRVVLGLPRRHPASAWSMRWNGTRREVTELVENPHLRTNGDARRVAERKRDRALREAVEYQIEALPVIPWLRPNTLVSVPTSAGRAAARVKQWTLPLGPAADPLVIGTNRRRGWRR